MKTKNLVTLAVTALVVVLLTVVCLTGVQVGKYIVIPAADGIARGTEFTGSTYAVLSVNEPAAETEATEEETEAADETVSADHSDIPASAEMVDEAIAVMRRRAEMLSMRSVQVSKMGENHVRVEIPTADGDTATSILYTLTQACHVTFEAEDGDVRLEGEDVVESVLGMDAEQTSYLLSIRITDEARSAWAAKTDNTLETITVKIDGTAVATSTANVILAGGIPFSDYNSAVNTAMALQTGRVVPHLHAEGSGIVPAVMGEEQFDNGIIAIAIATLVAAIVMIVVFKKTGIVAALSVVLTVVATIFFFGAVPYLPFGVVSFFALVAVVGVKTVCDLSLMSGVSANIASGMEGKEAVATAWRESGLKALEICAVAIIGSLVLQYFGGESVSAFTVVFAAGSAVSLLVSVIVTRPLTTCAVEKAAKEIK